MYVCIYVCIHMHTFMHAFCQVYMNRVLSLSTMSAFPFPQIMERCQWKFIVDLWEMEKYAKERRKIFYGNMIIQYSMMVKFEKA